MSTIVVMPGGFHPFHAGHAALYNSARRAFPDAEVFVAATNDTSTRPFPFAVKEKLAKLAGVEPGYFVQVKSPFRAEEITSQFNPDVDSLIFVRSEKDKTKPPQAGGNKKDGSPAYLQPLLSAKRLEPFGKHAYMAYLPTVEFGPGMTSATEIRGAWPTLNEKRKTALVMSLYPRTQSNPKLAATVVKLLDTAMGVVDESVLSDLPRPNKRNQFKSLHKQRKQRGLDEGPLPEMSSKILSASDQNGVITIVVQAPDGTKRAVADPNPNYINRWLLKYGLTLPRSITSKFVGVTENTAPNPRVDLTPNYPNYATLVGEFIGVKKNRVLFRIVSAELKPGQGETEKIFRAMTTNTPIGIEIGKVKNRAVLEALKPDSFAALQQAKQNIEQNRQQEVDQWAQDFRANSSKLAGQQLKQRFAEPPPEPPTMPVVQPGESPDALKARLAQLNIAKQKFEEINALIRAIKKKYQHSAIEAEITAIERRLETGLLPDVRAGVADNYKSLLAKLDNLKTSLTTRFIVKEAPDYIEEGRKI